MIACRLCAPGKLSTFRGIVWPSSRTSIQAVALFVKQMPVGCQQWPGVQGVSQCSVSVELMWNQRGADD